MLVNKQDYELEPVQVSALSQYLYCQRRCALVHIEQVWVENLFTAEGRTLHDKAHEERFESRGDMRIERGMPLRSERLGLNGKADVVEFQKDANGIWMPFPVEYKHGKPKENNCDLVQLCAQALCLEEILKVKVPSGAMFYGKTRRRLDVDFTEELRKETEETVRELREFIKAGKTPKAVYSKRCESCSLVDICMPKMFGDLPDVEEYIRKNI